MNYVYAASPDLLQHAPEGAVDISPGSGAGPVRFGVQDTVYLVGVENEKAVVVDIFRASGLMFNRPTIKRINALGVPAQEWSRW